MPAVARRPAGRHREGPQRDDPPHRARHPAHRGASYAGLGFGYGYAFAQDNICPIAEDYVTVNAERSRFFGPDGSYQQRGNGFGANNLNSDFFYKQIIDAHTIEALLAKPPPFGPVPEVKQVVRGYVAGYNRYLADVGGSNGVPDKTCRGKPWVRPITEVDAYRRFYQLDAAREPDVAIDGIGGAQPPDAGLRCRGPARPLDQPRPRRSSTSGCRSTRSARTPWPSAGPARATTSTACCSATRTSRGSAPSASTRRTSRSRAS